MFLSVYHLLSSSTTNEPCDVDILLKKQKLILILRNSDEESNEFYLGLFGYDKKKKKGVNRMQRDVNIFEMKLFPALISHVDGIESEKIQLPRKATVRIKRAKCDSQIGTRLER